MTTTRTPPRQAPAATRVAGVVAVLLVAVAVTGVHDLAVAQDWATGAPWATAVVDAFDGLTSSTGLAVAGGVVAALGAVLVLLTLTRGRRTHVPVAADDAPGADLWLTSGAVAALAHEIVDRSSGVISADVRTSGRRRVVIDVVSHVDAAQTLAGAQQALDVELGAATPVRLSVRTAKRREVTS